MNNKNYLGTVFGLVVVVLVVWGGYSSWKSRQPDTSGPRQAIFLGDGQIYFGYASSMRNQIVTLVDVYYFLPSPSELAFREEGVKVTLALSKKSIEFFKTEASKHHTQYQRMIRRLLDAYVDAQALTLRSSGTRQKRRAP